MSIPDKIISLIKRNRISTTEISDCLGKTGVIPNLTPLNRKQFRVGKIFWAYGYNESNWALHYQIQDFPEGQILVVDAIDCNDRALFGSLVSKFLMLYRQAAGVVVKGKLRDVPHLIKEEWPIWFEGPTPIGCYNRESDAFLPPDRETEFRKPYVGAIAVCDDSGVVIIPKEVQTKNFIAKLQGVEDQEDLWFDCVDRLKWTTYETVCLKKCQVKK
jgi:regulator of RNase E activity RraA